MPANGTRRRPGTRGACTEREVPGVLDLVKTWIPRCPWLISVARAPRSRRDDVVGRQSSRADRLGQPGCTARPPGYRVAVAIGHDREPVAHLHDPVGLGEPTLERGPDYAGRAYHEPSARMTALAPVARTLPSWSSRLELFVQPADTGRASTEKPEIHVSSPNARGVTTRSTLEIELPETLRIVIDLRPRFVAAPSRGRP